LVAKARGHNVYLLCWPQEGDAKVAATKMTVSAPGFEILDEAENRPGMDAMLIPAALNFQPFQDRSWRDEQPVWAALQTCWSDVAMMDTPETWDAVYTWSESWGQWWRGANMSTPGQSPRNFVPVGHPMSGTTDPLPLPPKSVLYYPFPWGAHHLDSLFYFKMQFEDRWNVKAARQAADKLGWPLVVSARDKVYLPDYTRNAADVVAHDDPATLLSRAGVFIHHCSSGVAEAVLANVPSWNIAPHGWKAYADRGVDFNPWSERNFYCWPGTGMRYEAKYGFVPFGVFKSARQEYIDRYLGWADGGAGMRILTDLEKRVQA
jgi:hypothetical protein